ncbi:hypothetical protein FB559_5939 [Actinoallomurus bryophytorum]|uniref:Uncharacterized protein n=2 Tax=Actinoallomurus bryophytorum TaxID=1490222 RepID=A0A543CT80_9ACTN|nr:hypothetical protein FB559_5939 [Actinoallomurus bryophytorum]
MSRIGTTLFVTVMLALFAAFGPFAILAIVLVVPALITGLGTHLLSQGRLVGAAVTLTATLPCAALAVTVPEEHAFTGPVAGIGSMLLVLSCALLGLTTEEIVSRPGRRRDGTASVAITFLAWTFLASTVTFVLAVVLGPDARGWMAPGAATCASLFALVTAVVCVAVRRLRAGAVFLALTLLYPGVWGGVVLVARTVREVPSPTSPAPLTSHAPSRSHAPTTSRVPSPVKSHCACYSGRPCSCPGG